MPPDAVASPTEVNQRLAEALGLPTDKLIRVTLDLTPLHYPQVSATYLITHPDHTVTEALRRYRLVPNELHEG